MSNHATNAAEATKAIMQGWLASNAKDPAMQAIIQAAIDAATAELRAENEQLKSDLALMTASRDLAIKTLNRICTRIDCKPTTNGE